MTCCASFSLTLSLPELPIYRDMVLPLEFVDKTLWCDFSNQTSLVALLHGAICFSIFFKMKFVFSLEF